MTNQEVMKLALDALEEITLAGMSGTGQESDEAMTEWRARQAWKFIGIAARALMSIKEALAKQEQDGSLINEGTKSKQEQDSTCNETLRAEGKAYPRTCKKCGLFGPCVGKPKQEQKRPQNCGTSYCSCIECVMDKQEQGEPVAWLDEYGNAFPLAAKQYSVVGKYWKPLYTHPQPAQPKREWVGLTDEEKSEIWCKTTGRVLVSEDTHVYADAIEAKLKAKNFATTEGLEEKNT